MSIITNPETKKADMNGKKLAQKFTIEQAVRRSHCAKTDENPHECAGTCTITPNGINLSCPLCGGDDISFGPSRYMNHAVDQARSILRAAGLDFDALSAERQAEVTWAVEAAHRKLKGEIVP